MMSEPIEEARRYYAEELRFTAKVSSRVVVDAFATVPRERFVGSGPWRILSPMAMAQYWTTEDADPRHVYHDVLIAIDEGQRLNNGQPSLWARMYDQLALDRGADVVHIGAGTGYYSAILAEIVGRTGRVTAIEIDPLLAARAADSLAGWPHATVIAADGFTFRPDRTADAIIVNAGVTHFSSVWFDALAAKNGRLLVPLTNAERWGGFVMVTRSLGDERCYGARFIGRVGIIPCVGGRDQTAEDRLTAALTKADFTAIRSLRRAPEMPDHTCWLAGDGWWLSTAPAQFLSSLLPRADRGN